MSRLSFVFTICFVLLGPIKIIPVFGKVVRDLEPRLQRRVAAMAATLSALVCLLLVAAGRQAVGQYELSLPALQLGGGLVLLLSALDAIFPRPEGAASPKEHPRTPWQIATSPLTTPTIVTPAGVAALLIFSIRAPSDPSMYHALAIALPIIIALDFLVMYFNARIIRYSSVMLALQLLGAALIFFQVALATETMLSALRSLGVITGGRA